jgi:hypothetical protein
MFSAERVVSTRTFADAKKNRSGFLIQPKPSQTEGAHQEYGHLITRRHPIRTVTVIAAA